MSTVLSADVILAVEAGRVVERGTHAELLALDGLYVRGSVRRRVRFRDGSTLQPLHVSPTACVAWRPVDTGRRSTTFGPTWRLVVPRGEGVRRPGDARRSPCDRGATAEKVAAAVIELIAGPLTRVGKPLRGPLTGCLATRRGTNRIVYQVGVDRLRVTALEVDHRSTVHRRR